MLVARWLNVRSQKRDAAAGRLEGRWLRGPPVIIFNRFLTILELLEVDLSL